MGGKIWYALILLALVGIVQAEIISTNLTVSIIPPSGTAYSGVKPTFACSYTSYNPTNGRVPVLGASVSLFFDTSFYSMTYDSVSKTYNYTFTTGLSAGAHSWNCTAYKSGFQYQMVLGSYVVQTGGGGGSGCGFRSCLLMEPAEQLPFGGMWTALVVVIAVIGIGIGYFVMKGALTASAGTARKKK